MPLFTSFPASYGTYSVSDLPNIPLSSKLIVYVQVNGAIYVSAHIIQGDSPDKDYEIFGLADTNNFLFIRKNGTSLHIWLSKSGNIISSGYLFARESAIIKYTYFDN